MAQQQLQVLQLRPGVNREGTSYAGEGGYYACDKMRFRSGLPEKIGGWVQYSGNTFLGSCKHYAEWLSLSGYYLLGVGTNIKYYILSGGAYFDITPFSQIDTLYNPFYSMYSTLSAGVDATQTTIPINSLSANNFSLQVPYVVRITTGLTYEDIYVPAVNASLNTLGTATVPCIRGYNGTTATTHTTGDVVSSSWLIVADPENNAVPGQYVVFSGVSPFPADNLTTQTGQEITTQSGQYIITSQSAGPYTSDVLNQEFEILVATPSYISIDTGLQSTMVDRGGGNCTASYELPPGAEYNTYFTGWGAGPWISLAYSGGASTLSATITSTATTIPLVNASSFSSSGGYAYIETELIQYTSVAGNSLTGVTRGVDQTTGIPPSTPSGPAVPPGHMKGAQVAIVTYAAGTHAWNTAYSGSGFSSVLRLWSANNYGQDLFYNPRGGSIYFWDAATKLATSGSVTGRGINLIDPAFSSITLDSIVVGNTYAIRSLGSTTNTQWNTLAGTTAVTYAAGDTFNCAATIATGYGTGVVYDPAIPAISSLVLTTDERHVISYGCNDFIGTPATTATNFVANKTYQIATIGTTDFTLVGAASNTPGISFIATGPGVGDGTAIEVIQDPMFIAWCDQEQPQVWYPTVTNTAGSYRLTYGSRIITAEKTRQEILVFTDTAVYSQQYLGAPYVYGFNPISVDITIVGQNAVTTTNGITYWMGQDKFYAYSGRVDTLPCALRQYVFDDINSEQFDQVFAGTNEKYNEVWWFYPSSGSLVNDRYVVYNLSLIHI